jgi:hypothetical protein
MPPVCRPRSIIRAACGLLVDSVRVLSRFVKRAKGMVADQVSYLERTCRSRLRSAKRVAQQLHRQLRRKGEDKEAEQKVLYQKLIETTEQMVSYLFSAVPGGCLQVFSLIVLFTRFRVLLKAYSSALQALLLVQEVSRSGVGSTHVTIPSVGLLKEKRAVAYVVATALDDEKPPLNSSSNDVSFDSKVDSITDDFERYPRAPDECRRIGCRACQAVKGPPPRSSIIRRWYKTHKTCVYVFCIRARDWLRGGLTEQ